MTKQIRFRLVSFCVLAVMLLPFFFAVTPKVSVARAATASLVIDPTQAAGESGKGIHDVSDSLYGIFFEDINHGADGGMSAELVCNQSFEYEYYAAAKVTKEERHRWTTDPSTIANATMSMGTSGGIDPVANPTFASIDAKQAGYRFINTGFQGDSFSNRSSDGYLSADYGMSFEVGKTYDFSLFVRNNNSTPFVGNISAFGISKSGNTLTTVGNIPINADSSINFKKYSVIITAEQESLGGLCIEFNGAGKLDFDFVSLMPTDAYGYKDSRWTGGKIKRSVIDAFAGMNPRFLRFPGGCVAEGTRNWENVYYWKNTVGSIEKRNGTFNLWEYYQSYNIGFYEYFLLCEDLGMKAMPVVSAGVICQARMTGDTALIHKYDSPTFKTEVVDMVAHLIYFAKGDVSSPNPDEAYWAKVRASMGHPEPFALDYISLGNENWGKIFWDNFKAALRELTDYKYDYYANNPINLLQAFEIQLVTSTYTDCWAQEWRDSWKEINGNSATSATATGLYNDSGLYGDLVADEHYYQTPSWYRNNVNRYANYDRNGAKVFLGEYSAHSDTTLRNTLEAALSEAAFMTGLERDSDIVIMASIAPLFGRWGNSIWETDAIWQNAKNIMFTPNYYVQKMYAANVGDKYIPANFSLSNSYQSITQDTVNKRFYVKLVNTGSTAHTVNISFNNVSNLRGFYTGETMSHSSPSIKNSMENAYDGNAVENVAPVAIPKTSYTVGQTVPFALKAYSVNVLVFPYGEEGSDDTLDYIKIGGKIISGFDAAQTDYTITLPFGTKDVPYMFVKPMDARANVSINYAPTLAQTTTVVVQSDNGANTKTYNISYIVAAQGLEILSPQQATINIEQTYRLSVEFPQAWASTFAVEVDSSSDAGANIAPVAKTNGREFEITPLKTGVIRLNLKNGAAVLETVVITVTDAPLKDLALLSSKTAQINMNQTYNLKVDYPQGFDFSAEPSASSTELVEITPDDAGFKSFTVTPKKVGTASIELKKGGVTVETVTIIITPAVVDAYVLISERDPTIQLGASYTIVIDYPAAWDGQITLDSTAETQHIAFADPVYGKNNREFRVTTLSSGTAVFEVRRTGVSEPVDTIRVTVEQSGGGGGNGGGGGGMCGSVYSENGGGGYFVMWLLVLVVVVSFGVKRRVKVSR